MKLPKFSILLFLVPIFLIGQTSTYHPLPDSLASWNITNKGSCVVGDITEHYTIEMTGDTIINTNSYHKLEVFFVDSTYIGFCNKIDRVGYQAAIREDTAQRKAYIVLPDSSDEQLLYDFNLTVGDTVKGYLSLTNDTVISIDSVLVNNSYHKRWYLNAPYSVYLVEGVGTNYGLIQPFSNIPDQTDYSINCMNVNGITIYPDTLNNCQRITSIEKVNLGSNPYNVYPNPSSGLITIALNKQGIKTLLLWSAAGKVVRELSTAKKEIQLNDLESRVYFLSIIDSNNISENKKVIVTN